MMELIYKETFDLSLKAIFILKVMLRLPDQEMNYSMDYDWLHRDHNVSWDECKEFNKKDVHSSMGDAWKDLIEAALIKNIKVRSDCYIKYIVTEKGKYFKHELELIDTSRYDDLIPEKFKKFC